MGQFPLIRKAAADADDRDSGVAGVPCNRGGTLPEARRLRIQTALAGDDQARAVEALVELEGVHHHLRSRCQASAGECDQAGSQPPGRARSGNMLDVDPQVPTDDLGQALQRAIELGHELGRRPLLRAVHGAGTRWTGERVRDIACHVDSGLLPVGVARAGHTRQDRGQAAVAAGQHALHAQPLRAINLEDHTLRAQRLAQKRYPLLDYVQRETGHDSVMSSAPVRRSSANCIRVGRPCSRSSTAPQWLCPPRCAARPSASSR